MFLKLVRLGGWPTAVGPGCPDLPELKHGWTVYHVDAGQLVANATCDAGFRFADSGTRADPRPYRTVTCSGYFWDGLLPQCQRQCTTLVFLVAVDVAIAYCR